MLSKFKIDVILNFRANSAELLTSSLVELNKLLAQLSTALILVF
ncbi:hypothetical protein AsAng_0012370 [Aureispira anguillae]|uniref:Uncharacterized protein n=1 Tax=Aureispira anguillae TaxID=2864201 RepID=A0A915YCF6_9BACT|nr:hypothetical protein AsAng_0012370 [Aureispira anguillae]